MIKINVLHSTMKPSVQRAVEVFQREHYLKSFSERNPQLGRKINCVACGLRHYSTKPCSLVYATLDREGAPYYEDYSPMITPLPDQTHDAMAQRNSILGTAAFARKRMLPHRHPRDLEILDTANKLFEAWSEYQEDEMKHGSIFTKSPDTGICVDFAKRTQRNRFERARKRHNQQADISRRINAGNARPGSRP